jgi:hypothetical protein
MKKELKLVEERYSQFEESLCEAQKRLRKLEQALNTYKEAIDALTNTVSNTELFYDGYLRDGQQPLLDATKQMQETQMSFNLQYLQLQSQMQHENRSYTAISNIMKTKHDTVKNSISNVR